MFALSVHRFKHIALLIFLTAQSSRADFFTESTFTEPPVDQEDFYRTYYLGQTVNVAWNQSAGLWPTVNLRIGPAFEWTTSYAILLNNAQNNGGFSWTVGSGDGINASLLAINPKMVFQLNDANNEDGFTLDSRAFLVLATNATTVPQSTTVSQSMSSTASLPTSTTSAAPYQAGSGLPVAAKVGIGIGVPLIVMLGITMALLVTLLRRQMRRKDSLGRDPIAQADTQNMVYSPPLSYSQATSKS